MPQWLTGDPKKLQELARATMPFGRYAGLRLVKLPEPYLVWFSREGFPRGKLGEQMALALEIKTHGLEPLIDRVLELSGDDDR